MAYDYSKKTDNEEKNTAENAGERQHAEPEMPNSMIMRIMEDPAAEDEADQLSSGVTSRTPGSLRREMGGRLGADFSSVRFHSDRASLSSSRAMGARAWAQGRDVYFGRGGFDPAVAAHELVHTVQQGAVKGNVSRSMPMGAVQLLPDDENKINNDDVQQNQAQKNNDVQGLRAIEKSILHFFATGPGLEVYGGFQSKLFSFILSKFNNKDIKITPAGSALFLVRACYRDFALRDIITEVAAKPVTNKSQRKERIREYKALITALTSRITPADAESLAIESGLFNGIPKYTQEKKRKNTRAYDVLAGENGLVDFNPNQLPELTKVQNAIDNARTPEQAYNIFTTYTGNPGGRFKDKFKSIKVDMTLFRNKLKHMARVVTDYPELKYSIGNMNVIDPNSNTMMSTVGTRGGERLAEFEYNKKTDAEGIWGDLERDIDDEKNKKDHFHISPRDYHGTHELGHAMASTLVKSDGVLTKLYQNTTLQERMDRRVNGQDMPQFTKDAGRPLTNQADEEEYGLPENDMLETVLAKDNNRLMRQNNMGSLKSYGKNIKLGSLKMYKDQIATGNLYKKGMTSKYGSKHASELFAEAVADVYSHGSGAKDLSKELVKEYENRQKKIVRDQFNQNRKSWWRRLFGL